MCKLLPVPRVRHFLSANYLRSVLAGERTAWKGTQSLCSLILDCSPVGNNVMSCKTYQENSFSLTKIGMYQLTSKFSAHLLTNKWKKDTPTIRLQHCSSHSVATNKHVQIGRLIFGKPKICTAAKMDWSHKSCGLTKAGKGSGKIYDSYTCSHMRGRKTDRHRQTDTDRQTKTDRERERERGTEKGGERGHQCAEKRQQMCCN